MTHYTDIHIYTVHVHAIWLKSVDVDHCVGAWNVDIYWGIISGGITFVDFIGPPHPRIYISNKSRIAVFTG